MTSTNGVGPFSFREAVDWDYVDPGQNNPALCLEATSLQPFNLIEGTSIFHIYPTE